MAASKLMMLVAVMAIASFFVPSTVAQTTRHVVGDTFGWTVPTDGNVTYSNWASRQTFVVGDTLVFNFTTGSHDVAEVSQAAYGPCTTTNPMSSNPAGPATLPLRTAGNHYYICTFGSHCQLGQKLSINVSSSPTSPSPTGSTTPSSPPPPPSSASSFSAVVPVTFLVAALAFFY